MEEIMRTWQRWGGEVANYWRVFFFNLPKIKDGEEGSQTVGVALKTPNSTSAEISRE
jgi:hypothetical protein